MYLLNLHKSFDNFSSRECARAHFLATQTRPLLLKNPFTVKCLLKRRHFPFFYFHSFIFSFHFTTIILSFHLFVASLYFYQVKRGGKMRKKLLSAQAVARIVFVVCVVVAILTCACFLYHNNDNGVTRFRCVTCMFLLWWLCTKDCSGLDKRWSRYAPQPKKN